MLTFTEFTTCRRTKSIGSFLLSPNIVILEKTLTISKFNLSSEDDVTEKLKTRTVKLIFLFIKIWFFLGKRMCRDSHSTYRRFLPWYNAKAPRVRLLRVSPTSDAAQTSMTPSFFYFLVFWEHFSRILWCY